MPDDVEYSGSLKPDPIVALVSLSASKADPLKDILTSVTFMRVDQKRQRGHNRVRVVLCVEQKFASDVRVICDVVLEARQPLAISLTEIPNSTYESWPPLLRRLQSFKNSVKRQSPLVEDYVNSANSGPPAIGLPPTLDTAALPRPGFAVPLSTSPETICQIRLRRRLR